MSEVTILDAEPPPAQFAAATDVWIRLGRSAVFTDVETTRVDLLLQMAASTIASALDRDDEWIRDLAPVPPALRITSIEVVVRVLQNPGGVRSRQETLGSHSLGETFADASATLALTEAEERRCRRAVFKSGIGGPQLGSTVLEQLGPAIGAGSSQAAAIDGPATTT